MKYPIGIQSFDRIIEDGYVYVDKTDLIYQLAQEGSIYFLSRPRRFGKSLLVSTLEHYYLGHKELFKGLKIDQLEKDWDVYPVFHVDFNGSNFTQAGVLEERLEDYVSDWEARYGLTSDPYNYYILEACYIHNKKYKEVAEELNVSVAAIHKNIVKALRILREELGQKGNQNEF